MCHASQKALGHGIGGGKLTRPWDEKTVVDLESAVGHILSKRARTQMAPIDGLSADWTRIVTEDGQQLQTVGHHFQASRPLNNTERAHIVKIPIVKRNQPGAPEIVAAGVPFPDGVAFDATGHLLAVTPASNPALPESGLLYRVNVINGQWAALATADDGLKAPTSLAFGVKKNKRSVYVTNWALLSPPPDYGPPGLLKIDVGVKGLPLP